MIQTSNQRFAAPKSQGLWLPETSLNPSQKQFLDSKSTNLLFAAGLGSGKSIALILKAMQLKSENGDLPGLLLAPTYGSLFANIVDPLISMYERSVHADLVPRIVTDNKGRKQLQYADGGIQYLRSADRPGTYDGLNVAYLLGDELRYYSRYAYQIACARVRIKQAKRLQRCWATTPAIGFMSDDYDSGKKGFETIQCSSLENEHNLAPGYIHDLTASFSPRMRRCMIDGAFTFLDGAVFESFDPHAKDSPWIVDWKPTKDELRGMKVFLAVDPGYRRSAWIWWAEVKPLCWLAFDQAMLDNCSDDQAVKIINERGWPIDEVWTDPAADNTQSLVALDSLSVFTKIKSRNPAPLRTVDMYRDIRFGIDKLRVLLGGYEGMPIRFKFTRDLLEKERGQARGVIKSLSSYTYPESKDGRPVTDLPVKDGMFDHAVDCTRYLAVSRWLCDPRLRSLDRALLSDARPGWRVIG